MNTALNRCRRGFTLVEMMIVVAIIALIAAIAVPNVLRARKRSQATKLLDDLRVLDQAMDQWALEKHKQAGDVAQFSDLQPYLKQANKLNLEGHDMFGAPFGPYSVDVGPKIAESSFNALSDVAPAEFWSPYR